ncbi:MAG: hypothetical protein HOP34_09120 [Methylococcaceae bacterium]|nr:hypothetical protein [Methylococcaceae bacterium]
MPIQKLTKLPAYLFRPIKTQLAKRQDRLRAQGKTKYFCIGRNKTGTTSLKQAFLDLGYPVGDQRKAELLADRHYFDGNFEPIIAYCQSAQVFQDVPFSWPETFKHLDNAYPGSKFILTLRDSPEQGYSSITRFHAKLFGGGQIPTAAVLSQANYVRKGFMLRALKLQGGTDADIYNKTALLNHYQQYNQSVLAYFKDRPDDLLVINLSEADSYQKFGLFPISWGSHYM